MRPARQHHFARALDAGNVERRAAIFAMAPITRISATASRMLGRSARPTSASEYPEKS